MILVYQCMAPYIDHLFRAVAAYEPVTGVETRLSEWGYLRKRRRLLREEPFPVVQVDMPRGYGRKFFRLTGRRLAATRGWCEQRSGKQVVAVVFTIPHFAPLADDFADCIRIYYVADDYRGYGWGDRFVERREREMVEHVDHVFCVSNKLRDRFVEGYGMPEDRCHLSPNATRAENLLPAPLAEPLPLPPEANGLERPVAGVIGRLGANTDFCLLLSVAQHTPWLNWLLVGPLLSCADTDQSAARSALLGLQNVKHVGRQPYESLAAFARALDVAVIPYTPGGMTPYRSPVRLFDHIAATRPIVANRGCAQCEEHAHILALADSPSETCLALDRLRAQGFDDGLAADRWRASRSNTWADRARRIVDVVGRGTPPAMDTRTAAGKCTV